MEVLSYVEYTKCVELNVGKSGWEIIAEDESKDADQHGSLGNLDSSPGTSSHKMGHGSSGESQMSFSQFIYFVIKKKLRWS